MIIPSHWDCYMHVNLIDHAYILGNFQFAIARFRHPHFSCEVYQDKSCDDVVIWFTLSPLNVCYLRSPVVPLQKCHKINDKQKWRHGVPWWGMLYLLVTKQLALSCKPIWLCTHDSSMMIGYITGLSTVCLTVLFRLTKRTKSSALVRGIHRWPAQSVPVMRKATWLVQANNKENIKAPAHRSFMRGIHRWIPLLKSRGV